MKIFEFEVSIDLVDLRIDKALGAHPEIGSRTRAVYLIDRGLVTINSSPVKASTKLNLGDLIRFEIAPQNEQKIEPLNLKLDVVYEDDDLIVVNKPSGLVVHPAAGHAQDTLVNALIHHTSDLSMRFGEDRPGIVHRLDKETSGLLVVAKNDRSHEFLSRQFSTRKIHRIYHAMVLGAPLRNQTKGRIISFLARHPTDRKRFASILDSSKKIHRQMDQSPKIGKVAITNYETLWSKNGLSYLKVRLETGRTHQIRVHLSELGNPILGDITYGASTKTILNKNSGSLRLAISKVNRVMLHASELGFIHPQHQRAMHFSVQWPTEAMQIVLQAQQKYEP